MVRAPFYDESGLKKGAWSQEEDDKLRDYIQKYGHWNWRELPKFAGLSRCGKSCRLRWMNYLRPEVKRGNYTKEEEDTILRLHADLGNKWSMIAAQLPGRTDNEIKNYWHTHLKNRGKKYKKASNEKEMESDGTSEYGGSQSRKSESENFLASMTSLHILESSPFTSESTSYHQFIESSPLTPESKSYRQVIESSPLSDPETSSTTYYSSTSNWEPLPQMNWVSETSSDSYAQFSGDFWTEPFVPDNSYIPPDREYLSDGPYLSSPYNSDSMDLFNYQQLPEDSAYRELFG